MARARAINAAAPGGESQDAVSFLLLRRRMIRASPQFTERSGRLSPLFDLKPAGTSSYVPLQYDVAPDGKRFLVVRRAAGEESESDPVVVDLNWTGRLRQ